MISLRHSFRRIRALTGLVLAAGIAGGCLANVTVYPAGEKPVALALLDANGDGRTDVAVLDAATHTIVLRTQEEGGALGAATTLVPAPGSGPTELAAVTGPGGAPELAVVEPGGDRVALFADFSDGAHETAFIPLPAGSLPKALTATDLNGDGYPDLLVTSAAPTTGDDGSRCDVNGCVTILYGSAAGLRFGGGSGSHVIPLAAGDDPADILVADVTGDPAPDLIVAGAHDTVVFPGLGGGHFDEAHPQRLPATGGLVVATRGGATQLAIVTAPGTATTFAAGTLAPAGTVATAALLPMLPATPPTVKAASARSGVALGQLDTDHTPDLALLLPAYTDSAGAHVSGTVDVLHSAAVWRTRFPGDFGTLPVGTATRPHDVGGDLQAPYVTAAVPLPLRYTASVALAGPDASSFRVSAFPCAHADWTHNEDANCLAQVSFAPRSAGLKQATLVISFRTDHGPPAPPVVHIPLTGTGSVEFAAETPRYGVSEDASKYADDGGKKVYADLETLGMTVNRWTLLWYPEDPTKEFNFLDHALVDVPDDVQIVLSLAPRYALQHNPGRFCSWARDVAKRYPQVRRFIIGNEPNQPRFWRPQFVKGKPVAGAAYAQLLGACYDALKGLDPTLQVIGFGLSPRGNDKPDAKSNVSTSPIRFLLAAATAYRRSGRRTPLMDELAVHPYPNPNQASDGPNVGYPSPWNFGIPNLDRVEAAVFAGFNGTGQPTTMNGLRLVVDETGWQTTPDRAHRRLYTGKEVTKTVSEARQGTFDTEAIQRYLACDPAVSDIYFFHLIDESDLGRFQSGLEYPNGDRKPAFAQVQQAIKTGCAGLRIAWAPGATSAGGVQPLLLELAILPSPPVLVSASANVVRNGLDVALGAALAESAQAEADLLPVGGGAAVAHKSLLVRAGKPITLAFRGRISAGRYTVKVTLTGKAQLGLSATKTLVTKQFRVG